MKYIKNFSLAVLLILSVRAAAQESNNSYLNDSKIMSVVIVSSQIEIDNVKLILTHSKNDAIRNYAQIMLDDHCTIIEQIMKFAKRSNTVPKDNFLVRI